MARECANLWKKRRASQLLDLLLCGQHRSKRPQGGFAAAPMYQAGLKGFAIGGRRSPEKHAGFVEPRRSDVRGRHAAHATYTENRF